MYNYKPGSRYRFRVYPAQLMTAEFHDAKLQGIVDHEIANTMIDIYSSHARIYPTLPSTVPDDATACMYGVFLTSSGIREVLALTWIDESSIEVVSAQRMTVEIMNCTPSDVQTVRAALLGIGKEQINIKLSE